jgi:hypothetical protein
MPWPPERHLIILAAFHQGASLRDLARHEQVALTLARALDMPLLLVVWASWRVVLQRQGRGAPVVPDGDEALWVAELWLALGGRPPHSWAELYTYQQLERAARTVWRARLVPQIIPEPDAEDITTPAV